MPRILFVCTGNICRSPTADGVARQLARQHRLTQFEFDSAGTHAYHTGEAPDPRAQRAARARGYNLAGLHARPVCDEDFAHFDLILAMDRSHMVWLKRQCPAAYQHKLSMFLDHCPGHEGDDLPDPYYGDGDGFENVLTLCEDTVRALLGLNSQ